MKGRKAYRPNGILSVMTERFESPDTREAYQMRPPRQKTDWQAAANALIREVHRIVSNRLPNTHRQQQIGPKCLISRLDRQHVIAGVHRIVKLPARYWLEFN